MYTAHPDFYVTVFVPRVTVEKIILFASDQWLLITLLAAAVWGLFFIENQRAGKRLTPQTLTQLVNGDGAVVVDLREKNEYEQGHIVDATNIPYKSLQGSTDGDAYEAFAPYRDKAVVVVCKMGQHSSHVAKQLAQKGYDVYRLGGGLMEWQSAQLPLVK